MGIFRKIKSTLKLILKRHELDGLTINEKVDRIIDNEAEKDRIISVRNPKERKKKQKDTKYHLKKYLSALKVYGIETEILEKRLVKKEVLDEKFKRKTIKLHKYTIKCIDEESGEECYKILVFDSMPILNIVANGMKNALIIALSSIIALVSLSIIVNINQNNGIENENGENGNDKNGDNGFQKLTNTIENALSKGKEELKEEKLFWYETLYKWNEGNPRNANGQPTEYEIIEVNNDYATYEIWIEKHFNSPEKMDKRDLTKPQYTVWHTTAGNDTKAEVIRDNVWSYDVGVSATGMMDEGLTIINGKREPRVVNFEPWDQACRQIGTEGNWCSVGFEHDDGENAFSDEETKMSIDFTAVMFVMNNSNKMLLHAEVYDEDSWIIEGSKAIRYAEKHGDPEILVRDSALKEQLFNEVYERAKYYRDEVGLDYTEYMEYARNKKMKETQQNISEEAEKYYKNLTSAQKANIAKAYRYFSKNTAMDEICVDGILGYILGITKGNPEYLDNQGNFGMFAFNEEQKKELKQWAKENDKDMYNAEDQIEFYYKFILKNATYNIGKSVTDGKYYTFPINYENLKFECPSYAAYWIARYAQKPQLEQSEKDFVQQMSEIIYEHKDELKNFRLAQDWKEDIKYEVDTKQIMEAAYNAERSANDPNEIEIRYYIQGY